MLLRSFLTMLSAQGWLYCTCSRHRLPNKLHELGPCFGYGCREGGQKTAFRCDGIDSSATKNENNTNWLADTDAQLASVRIDGLELRSSPAENEPIRTYELDLLS